MAKKIEQQITEDGDVKTTAEHFLDEALKAVRKEDDELAVFYLEEARRVASEIDYDIDDKIKEITEIASSWNVSRK